MTIPVRESLIALAVVLLSCGLASAGAAESSAPPLVEPSGGPLETDLTPGELRSYAMPRPPALPNVKAGAAPPPAVSEPARPTARGAPRLAQCYTAEEYNRAGMGRGCDCSCGGYAVIARKGPVEERRCTIACGAAYYRCWAPQPTDAEVEAAIRDTGASPEQILREPGARQYMTALVMNDRAFAWDKSQRCSPE